MKYVLLQKATTLPKKKILIWDLSYAAEHAKRIAEDGHSVYFFTEWLEPLPKFTRYSTGLGLNGVIRVKNFYDYIDKVDLIAFMFIGRGDLASWLRSKGYLVYGAGRGERLETDRIYAKKIQKEAGLPVQPYEVFNSVDDVLNYIKKGGGDKFVKINIFRGDLESFKVIDYDTAELLLNTFKVSLGPYSDSFQFLVEDKIDSIVETGFDLFFNGRQFLKPYLWGYMTGRYYIGKYSDTLPAPLALVAEKITPYLQNLDYRGSISVEVIIDEKRTPYIIDWTCRFPYPLSYIYTQSMRNYSDVIWAVASGENIEIQTEAEYVGCLQLLTTATNPIKSWVKVNFPKSIESNIKLKQLSRVRNKNYTMPGEELEVAVVVTSKDNPRAVLSDLESLSKKIDTASIDAGEIIGSKNNVLKLIETGKAVGLEF